ncbi:von Willebrand factor type A domain-containing protein [Xylariaceae sp. FL0255]|nr:von Willebrand factor type A domain-containing protein [Xylariaceae sp. FL0255]
MAQPICGCWYYPPLGEDQQHSHNKTLQRQRSYLPIKSVQFHTTIKDVASRTVLTQSFLNNGNTAEIVYSFPLYDGVSVVSFNATIGDNIIYGAVKEKDEARREYQAALNEKSSAALLEQLPEASDVFTTHVGNVGANERVDIELVYIGELKHDAETNGIRFTIPTSIAPRYGTTQDTLSFSDLVNAKDGITATIDFQSPEGCPIQQIQSPSHPVDVTLGRTAGMPEHSFSSSHASVVLSLNETTLDKEFIVIASVKDFDKPKAFLETHPALPKQRALMATLVPKFNLAPSYGEIVFIMDRSGSMGGKIEMVINAMTILLKSLPMGVKFNICSFGTTYKFLWPQSQPYNDSTLISAMGLVETFDASFGGTEMLGPVQATFAQSLGKLTLDIVMLTDGEIWDQEFLFNTIRLHSEQQKSRVFCLGIGAHASTSLVEGVSAAGNGFSQFVTEHEKIDKKMVQLLKGALSPRINNLSFEMKFKEDDFEIVEPVSNTPTEEGTEKRTMSFFDDNCIVTTSVPTSVNLNADTSSPLPTIPTPALLQAPATLPPLYPFSRTTVYVLLDSSLFDKTPEVVVLKGTTAQDNLELEIQIEDIGNGETLHQLAARKAVHELENGRGWLDTAADKIDNILLKNKHAVHWKEMVKREAVRLGVTYQIAGKWCSFIAVESNGKVHNPADQPAHIRRSHGGLSKSSQGQPCSAYRSPSTAVASGDTGYSDTRSSQSAGGPGIAFSSWNDAAADYEHIKGNPENPSASNASLSPLTNVDKVHAVIRLQNSDGSWSWGEALLDILGNPQVIPEKQNSLMATILAVAFLQSRDPDELDAWELLVGKAKGWLNGQPNVDIEMEIEHAKASLKM